VKLDVCQQSPHQNPTVMLTGFAPSRSFWSGVVRLKRRQASP